MMEAGPTRRRGSGAASTPMLLLVALLMAAPPAAAQVGDMSEREEDDLPVCDEVDAEGRPLGSCRWSRDRIPLYISPPSSEEGESGSRYSVVFHVVSSGPTRLRQGTIIDLFGNQLVLRVFPDEDGTLLVERMEHRTTVASTTPIPATQ